LDSDYIVAMSKTESSHSDLKDPAYWNRAIAVYEEMAAPFTSYFAQAALTSQVLDASTKVLDVGCGTGALAVAAAERGARVTAIDFSPAMVEHVRSLHNPAIEAHQMDGQAMTLPSASHDVVASIFGVMLFPDWEAGLAEMFRVTRPGGHGVVASWVQPDGAAINLLMGEVIRELLPGHPLPPSPAGMLAMATPAGMSDALCVAGFAGIETRHITHDFGLKLRVLDDVERYFGILPMWNSLSVSQRAVVAAELRRRGERDGVEGVLPIASTALIGVGRRPG
jgi:SAM-dependent methyltransferase